MKIIPAPEIRPPDDLSLPVFTRASVEETITHNFARIVDLYPQRVAVKGLGCELTYSSLDKKSKMVAHAILQNEPASVGQVCTLAMLENGIIAILGVLKAGKTYVPLDPALPPARLADILSECEIETIVTETKYVSLAQTLSNGVRHVIVVDDLDPALSVTDPDVVVWPESLAAIFYTSGSTGQPKGVMQTHRNVLHRVHLATQAFGFCPQDRVTLISPLTYSATLLELFSPLLNGSEVYPFNVAEEGVNRLADWITRQGITIYHSVPTVWRQVTDNLLENADLHRLRAIRLGGDTLTGRDVELFKSRYPSSCTFFNGYSSNEAGLIRLYPIDRKVRSTDREVPIGYPLSDKEILVLNVDGTEASPGEVGEIVIRSEFLSPGYWKNPELTDSVFRADPKRPGQKLYYSGDLGTFGPGGCLFHKGRADSRVKIRGVGVETAPLEEALHSHPDVREAIAVAKENASGERNLVGYIVLRANAALKPNELRRFLRDKLPENMVAASFVFLERLPRTPNGKVDRAALPTATPIRSGAATAFVPPEDRWEKDVADMCQVILGVGRIGSQDDLFDLGMDSLAAVRLVAQIEKQFKQQIPPTILLESPTVALIASALRRSSPSDEPRFLVPVQPAGSKPPLFFVHGDFASKFLRGHLGADQPLYAVDHQSLDGKPAVYTTVETIAAAYIQKIQTIQPKGPYFISGYSFGGIVALEMAQQLSAVGDAVALLALLDPPGFTMSQAPVRRMQNDRSVASRLLKIRSVIGRHYKNMKIVAREKRLNYVFGVAFTTMQRFADLRGIRRIVKPMLWKIHLAWGARIPAWLLGGYRFAVYDRARLNYVPRVYKGRTIFFRGTEISGRFQAEWESLLKGDVEFFQLGDVDHLALRDESFVHLWADQLKVSLESAQARLL